MNIIFELSKEHRTLPPAEICACLQAENIKYEIREKNENILSIDADFTPQNIETLAHRLSFTFSLSELLFSSSVALEEIQTGAEKHPIKNMGSIAVRCKNRSTMIASD